VLFTPNHFADNRFNNSAGKVTKNKMAAPEDSHSANHFFTSKFSSKLSLF
jgi:hypothetical protein